MNRSILLRAVMLGLLSVSVKAMMPIEAQPFSQDLRRAPGSIDLSSRDTACENATWLTDCSTSGTYSFGAGEAFWFIYQGEGYGLEMTTCHEGTDVDSDLYIFSGDCANLTQEFYRDGRPNNCNWLTYLRCEDFTFEAGQTYYIALTDYYGNAGSIEAHFACCAPQPFECPAETSLHQEPDACADFLNALDCGTVACGDLADSEDVDHYWMTVSEASMVELNVYADDTPGQAAFGFGCDPYINVYSADSYSCDEPIASDDDGGEGYDSYLALQLDPGIYMVAVYTGWNAPGPYLLEMSCTVACNENNTEVNPDVLVTVANYNQYMGEANALSFAMAGEYCNIESVGPGCFSNGHCIADLDGGEYWFQVYQPESDCIAMMMSVSPAYYPQPEATCTPLIGVAQDGTLLGWFALDASEGLYPSNYNNTGSEQTTFIIDAPASCEGEVMVNVWYENLCVEAEELPASFSLAQNHPNPFNPATTIEFSLSEASEASLTVFDMTGREVATLANGMLERGTHAVTFDATGLASGVYFYTLRANGVQETRKMALLK